MIKINDNYGNLAENYLFSEISEKVKRYKNGHPDADIISLGIGDVTKPLCNTVIKALKNAVSEMADARTFRGYAPECGYEFLIKKIIKHDFIKHGIDITPEEVFINDGAKSGLGHFGDILGKDNTVAITDPVYPVYVDTNVMDGRAGEITPRGDFSKIIYLKCKQENDFAPVPPAEKADIIYLCSPNNPTGSVLNRTRLKEWVDYAIVNESLIIFDAAYEAFIREDSIPHSIYEIEGAKNVAVEVRSFSKTAGFTGLRCGYMVVPEELYGLNGSGKRISLNSLWRRHQSTKFNGTAYIVQRAAEATYSTEGMQEIREVTDYYMENAELILNGLSKAGIAAYGGKNAPYIWMKTPLNMSSWNFFDKLLNECGIIGTPGIGFGPSGEGYFRFTSFASRESVREAMDRILKWKIL